MSEILTIGLHAEGTTDHKFYKPLIERTIKDIVLDYDGDIEIYSIVEIPKTTGTSYKKDVLKAAITAYDSGLKCLILHCDADANTANNTMQHKIDPALEYVKNHAKPDSTKICTNLVPLIPVYMTEAWMLSDLELLKEEIDAIHISNADLGFTKKPEQYSDPKNIIISAMRIAVQSKAKHRRKADITELYTTLANKIPLDKLRLLQSYQDFYSALKKTCLPYC